MKTGGASWLSGTAPSAVAGKVDELKFGTGVWVRTGVQASAHHVIHMQASELWRWQLQRSEPPVWTPRKHSKLAWNHSQPPAWPMTDAYLLLEYVSIFTLQGGTTKQCSSGGQQRVGIAARMCACSCNEGQPSRCGKEEQGATMNQWVRANLQAAQERRHRKLQCRGEQ